MKVITMSDIGKILNNPIVLAQDSDSVQDKTLTFFPDELKYRIEYSDVFSTTSTSFKHPQDALDYYNKQVIEGCYNV